MLSRNNRKSLKEDAEADTEGSLSELESQQYSTLSHEIKNQTILVWNYRSIRNLPPSLIEKASHIKQLYLRHNQLVRLPDNLGSLHHLTFLYLYENRLEELPESVGDLVSLQVLDVSKNLLRNLPASIGRLSNLRSLVASFNKLSSLPKEICHLRKLSILILIENELTNLPASLNKLRALQGLYIDSNYLRTLPHTIVDLPLLAHISCCSNILVSLPCKSFTSSLNFFFDSNPHINFIPFALLNHLKVGDSFEPFVVPSFGCFENTLKEESISFTFDDSYISPSVLSLPCQLEKISRYGHEETRIAVTPLVELCLRFIWRYKFLPSFKAIKIPGLIPEPLRQLLLEGPIVYCEQCQMAKIFTYTSAIVISVLITSQNDIPGRAVPSVLFFCNDACAKKFCAKVKSFHEDYSKWLARSLASSIRVKLP